MRKARANAEPREATATAEGSRSPARLVAGAVTLLCLAAYWLTRGEGPYWQDSGLFLAALKAGGGLLSPGYPIYLLLGRPFVWLFRLAIPGVTFAEAGNFFSSCAAALAAGFTTLSIATALRPGYRFFAAVSPISPDRVARPGARLLAAALGGLLAGLSYSLWFQALTAEAYALNTFFAALVVFLFLRLGEEGPLGPSPSGRQQALLLLLLAAHGFSMGNHPVTIVFLPALAWLAWTGRAALRDRRLATFAAAAWAGCAFLPYLSLLWAARAHPTNPFGDVTTLPALLRHMLGAQWTGEARSYGFAADRFATLPVQLWQELFAVGLFGFALGLAWLWKRQRLVLAFVAVVALPAAFLPLAYLRGGEYDFWLLPLYLLCFTVAGLGLGWLFDGIARASIPLPLRIGLVALLATGALAWPLAVNPDLVSRRGDSVPEDFGRNLYRPLKPEAVLVVTSDQENALTYYLEVVERLRPDVARVDAGSVATSWYADYLRRRYPGLEVPESFSEPGLRGPGAGRSAGARQLPPPAVLRDGTAHLRAPGRRGVGARRRPLPAQPDARRASPARGLGRHLPQPEPLRPEGA